ncbi:hypothetical protein [Acinetobacter baumannii]|uniref:hypothetical protein n=1 Tax=Acinetobacter baumannii TaxID=470 RepID=UPI0022777122|nr:hypothetical protein [Acinetobacter baumannii]
MSKMEEKEGDEKLTQTDKGGKIGWENVRKEKRKEGRNCKIMVKKRIKKGQKKE